MAIKLCAFFVTLSINVTVGVAIFFFTLLAMNGFSESDASYGIGAYTVLAVLVSLIMSSGAVVAVHLMMKKRFRPVSSTMIAIPIFSLLGAGLKIVCSIIGVMIAEYVRVNY